MTHLKEPPKVIIRTGYFMTKARMHWQDKGHETKYYLERSLDFMKKSIAYMQKEDGMYEMEAGETMDFLLEALHAKIMLDSGAKTDKYRAEQGKWKIARAHDAARQVLKKYGYREITKEDFLEFGDGGGR